MRHFGVLVGVLAVSLVGAASGVAVSSAAPPDGITVVPVYGQAAGHGLRLFVDVFYARGGNPGPPGGGGGGGGGPSGGGTVDCTDTNNNLGSSEPFATASPLITLAMNSSVDDTLKPAVTAAAKTWSDEGAGLNVVDGGESNSPSNDGVSTIGWIRIAPKKVLAATWSWIDANNRIIEADVFFNTSYKWAVLDDCPLTGELTGVLPSTGQFDVGDIAVHEFGHVLGLSHYSDTGAQATMYPSAPADEVRKRTLTPGDIAALSAPLTP